MTSRAHKILEEALTLPIEQRAYLVEALQESIGPIESQEEVDDAWKAEIARRLQSIKDGSAVLDSLEDVEQELSQVLEEG
jgi:putative addiction module component (TIGR02574 family)